MSIVRVGLAETKNFAEGYEAIFGKSGKSKEEQPQAEQKVETSACANPEQKLEPRQ